MQLDASDWIALISIAVALLSLGFSWQVVRRQNLMQEEQLRLQLDESIVAWAHAALDDLSRTIEMVEQNGVNSLPDVFSELRWRLAARIDQGRLFFANEATPEYASSAEPSKNRGHRRAVLDSIAFAFYVLSDRRSVDLDRERVVAFLKHCRGLLYTEVQKTIDPRSREAMLRRLDANSVKRNDLQWDLARQLENMLPGTLKRFDLRRIDLTPPAS